MLRFAFDLDARETSGEGMEESVIDTFALAAAAGPLIADPSKFVRIPNEPPKGKGVAPVDGAAPVISAASWYGPLVLWTQHDWWPHTAKKCTRHGFKHKLEPLPAAKPDKTKDADWETKGSRHKEMCQVLANAATGDGAHQVRLNAEKSAFADVFFVPGGSRTVVLIQTKRYLGTKLQHYEVYAELHKMGARDSICVVAAFVVQSKEMAKGDRTKVVQQVAEALKLTDLVQLLDPPTGLASYAQAFTQLSGCSDDFVKHIAQFDGVSHLADACSLCLTLIALAGVGTSTEPLPALRIVRVIFLHSPHDPPAVIPIPNVRLIWSSPKPAWPPVDFYPLHVNRPTLANDVAPEERRCALVPHPMPRPMNRIQPMGPLHRSPQTILKQ